MTDLKNSKTFTAFQLKLLAIITMFIDHVTWAFVPEKTLISPLLHILGMMTAPLMCFFIVEGYHKTRSVSKYALRLGLFAVIAYVPYILFESNHLPNKDNYLQFNVLYTLLLGLLSLIVVNKVSSKALRILFISLLCILSLLGDWMFFIILFVLAFNAHYGNRQKQIQDYRWAVAIMMVCLVLLSLLSVSGLSNSTVSIWDFFNTVVSKLGSLLIIPFIRRYKGQRGSHLGGKWFFYAFYPLHLMLLYGIRLILV